MGQHLNKFKARKTAKEKLETVGERRNLALIIHYSCESFYDIKDGRTPRVTSIAVRNFESGQTLSFSIHKSAELQNIPITEIVNYYDDLEKHMLNEFFAHLKTVTVQTFLHWNMRDINYGFPAIEHRYRVLGGVPVVVEDARKIDLARELITIFGVGYTPHGKSGRLHSLMELNSITAKDALTGKEEADAFENGEFVKLHQSTLRKVDVIANILERTLDGSLKTKSNWIQQNGIHPGVIVEVVTKHWVWSLFAAFAAISAVVSRLTPLF
jgi:hypothetical protein